MGTSKKLAVWAVIIATVTASASYTPAALGAQTVESLSGTIFTTCVGYLITYAAKGLGGKHSRNKYRVDENGVPWGDGNY
jgi:hypothetical protein